MSHSTSSRPQTSRPLMKTLLITGGMILAVFFGLVSFTADPMLIGMAIGIFAGPALLLVPEFVVWVILVASLLMGILSSSPQFGKATWAVSLLSMLLLVPSLLNVLWNKKRHLPFFLWLALAFMGYAILLTAFQWYSAGEFLAGFKRYFQAFGLMLALVMYPFPETTLARWKKFLFSVALLQFPFALFELLVLVPMRTGGHISSEATDIVAGTFGANLIGGSPNSVMVIYVFIACAFLIARKRAGLLAGRQFWIWLVICALPLFMGETKVAVFMIPLVGIILMKKEIFRSPLQFFAALLIIAILTLGLAYFYITVIIGSNLHDVLKATLAYNIGSHGYSQGQLLNRFSSITFWMHKQNWGDPTGFLVGHGIGASYTATTGTSGHIGAAYPGYGINLTAVSTLLWDTGLVGTLFYASIFIAAWFTAEHLAARTTSTTVIADLQAIQAAIGLFMLSLFYSDSIVNLLPMEIIYAVVLGYLGYLVNQHWAQGTSAGRRVQP